MLGNYLQQTSFFQMLFFLGALRVKTGFTVYIIPQDYKLCLWWRIWFTWYACLGVCSIHFTFPNILNKHCWIIMYFCYQLDVIYIFTILLYIKNQKKREHIQFEIFVLLKYMESKSISFVTSVYHFQMPTGVVHILLHVGGHT